MNSHLLLLAAELKTNCGSRAEIVNMRAAKASPPRGITSNSEHRKKIISLQSEMGTNN